MVIIDKLPAFNLKLEYEELREKIVTGMNEDVQRDIAGSDDAFFTLGAYLLRYAEHDPEYLYSLLPDIMGIIDVLSLKYDFGWPVDVECEKEVKE